MAKIKGLPTKFKLFVDDNGKPVNRKYEEDYATFVLDALVYIQGEDVSKYISGNITINIADRDGYNTANFSLDNAGDKFILTADNLNDPDNKGRTWRLCGSDNQDDRYAENIKFNIFHYKMDPERNPSYTIAKTTAVTGFDAAVMNNVKGSAKRGTTNDPNSDKRWPLYPKSIIFNKNDPVRIFIKNPLSERDEWFFGFTGYIDTCSVNNSYVDASSEIQVTCYCIKSLMQKMRVQMNPLLGIITPTALMTDPNSLFQDFINPKNMSHPFANMPFVDVVKRLILSDFANTNNDSSYNNSMDKGLTQTENGKPKPTVSGVGNFTLGLEETYPKRTKEESIKTLEAWHTHYFLGYGRDTFLTKGECAEIGSETTSDGKYAPHNGKLNFLLPADGTGPHNLIQYSFEEGSTDRSWASRFQIISEFCGILDYQFITTPAGDLAFEFPMYDFTPEYFGQWSSIFMVDKHLISDNFVDESSDICTALRVTGGFAFQNADPGLPARFMTALVVSPLLAARVGINMEEESLPFVHNKTNLNRFAFLSFQKRLAAATSMSMDFAYRPFLLPNRPLVNLQLMRMGLTSGVSLSLDLFSDGNTNTDLKYIRTVRNDDKNGFSFRLITGAANMPISYNKIFGNDSSGNENEGVIIITEEPTTITKNVKSNTKVEETKVKEYGMDIITTYSSPNKESRRGKKISSIIIHDTESRKFDLTLRELTTPGLKKSTHYIIDKDGKTYRLVDEAEEAYHAGPDAFFPQEHPSGWIPKRQGDGAVNIRSVSVELMNEGNGIDPFPEEQMKSLKTLVDGIKKKYGISEDRILGHRHVAPARKKDPASNFDWSYLGLDPDSVKYKG